MLLLLCHVAGTGLHRARYRPALPHTWPPACPPAPNHVPTSPGSDHRWCCGRVLGMVNAEDVNAIIQAQKNM